MNGTMRRRPNPSRIYLWLFALLMAGAASLLALQPAEAESGVLRCLTTQIKAEKDGAACIGRMAEACSVRPQAQSTAGQAECADRELKVWQALLTRHYNGLVAVLDTPVKKQKLQTSQALWSKLRDADCGLAYAFFDGGSMAIPMMRYCTMKTTARRALMLRQWQESLTPR